MIKKFVVINVSYIAEVDETLLSNHDNDSIWENFEDDFPLSFVPCAGLEAKYESSSMVVLDPSSMNCFRCCKCNRWITNKDMANCIEGLAKGYVIDNKPYCSECMDMEE